MAIRVPSAFQLTSNEPIDTRLILTKDEMRVINDERMPDLYFTICSDDNQLYIYNKSSTTDGDLGKFNLVDKVKASEVTSKIQRSVGGAADDTSTWDTKDAAEEYAFNNDLAYAGQVIYIKEDDSFYKIGVNNAGTKTLSKLPDEKFIENINTQIVKLGERINELENKILATADANEETLSLLTKLSDVLD